MKELGPSHSSMPDINCLFSPSLVYWQLKTLQFLLKIVIINKIRKPLYEIIKKFVLLLFSIFINLFQMFLNCLWETENLKFHQIFLRRILDLFWNLCPRSVLLAWYDLQQDWMVAIDGLSQSIMVCFCISLSYQFCFLFI